MQLTTFPVGRSSADDDMRQFERLVANLSSTFASLHFHEFPAAIVHTLQQVCVVLDVDRTTLIEFGDDGDVRAHHSQARPGIEDAPGPGEPSQWSWLLERLRQGSVSVACLAALPTDAVGERDYAQRSNLSSTLAVPVTIGGRRVGALVLGSTQRYRDWSPVAQDRARLLAEIIGSGLQRSRQEAELRASLAEIERLNSHLTAENVCLKEDIKTFHDFDEIVGESAVMRTALERLCQVAPLNCSVLLLGETGTGKELFARALHDRSRRHARTLVRVNCAALPPTLVESELFGHEKGAFTGAVGLRQGRFEIANGGTIFLDEIGDLPYDVQGKLLRVLQEGEFERVGSSYTRQVDVRVIAATHRNLEQSVAEGQFRADLFYRLNVFPIPVPALRDRRQDIQPLVWFFIHRHQRELDRRITKIPTHVIKALEQHDWPGNVRELENVIERALIRSAGDTLQLDETFEAKPSSRTPTGTARLDDLQRSHIENTLRQCGWRINGTGNAAERLGIHPNTLRFRMKKLDIMSPRDIRLASRAGS
jgi:transcriptional regulator with GAF, ATPase, and Fis domain